MSRTYIFVALVLLALALFDYEPKPRAAVMPLRELKGERDREQVAA